MRESTLETVAIESGVRRIVYRAKEHFEAPNWSRDGKTFFYNRAGKIYTLPVSGGTPALLDTGTADRCNNDHGLSPDGRWLAISHTDPGLRQSVISVLSSQGGTPKRVTPLGPSYWHGWSPDGQTLAYCAERNGEFDIYTIVEPAGEEKRLTTAKGLDDGPDYTPDGKLIYFNSERTGVMKIWRMNSDGTNQEQVTSDAEFADWFPHPSPDGKWLVLLSYEKDVTGHPADKDVVLRIMPLSGGKPRRAGDLVRRSGDDQRAFVVAGQQELGVCQLSDGQAVRRGRCRCEVETVRAGCPARQRGSFLRLRASSSSIFWIRLLATKT